MINTRQQIRIPRDPLLPKLAEQMDGVRAQVGSLHGTINSLEGKTAQLGVSLASLSSDFERFVQQDTAHKELALAETRLVRVRQELETDFGHHADIRRSATGLLRATDLAIVRQDTLRTAGEESMLSAPRGKPHAATLIESQPAPGVPRVPWEHARPPSRGLPPRALRLPCRLQRRGRFRIDACRHADPAAVVVALGTEDPPRRHNLSRESHAG